MDEDVPATHDVELEHLSARHDALPSFPSFPKKKTNTNTQTCCGKKIASQGEKDITMVTGAKEVVQASWQTVDITRPLSSVRQICLQGNRVLFCAQETPFGIEDTVYVLDLWLPPSPTRGFGRQG